MANSLPERGSGYRMTSASSLLCLSQIPCHSVAVATGWRRPVLPCVFLKYEWRPIFSGSFSVYRLFYGVLLVFSIRWQVPHCRQQKFSYDLRKAVATWPNKCHRFKLSDVAKKHGLGIVLVGANCNPFLKFSTVFKNASKLQRRNVHFHQQQIFLIYFKLLFWPISIFNIREIEPMMLDYGI